MITIRWWMRSAVLGAVVVVLLAACNGAGTPSATFDGSDCTYSGPDSVGENDIEVTFDNQSDESASLAFLALVDESARAEEAALVGTRASVGGAPPGGALELVGQLPADPGESATQVAPLTAGSYFLDCVTFTTAGPDEVWRVALLEVEG